MSERVKCPDCSLPTVENGPWLELVPESELLCDSCFEAFEKESLKGEEDEQV